MSSQRKNRLSDAAPGTAKRRAFSTRPKLGRPVGNEAATPRRRGLFEVADASLMAGGSETFDADQKIENRTEPNLVPENGALATDDLDDLKELDVGTFQPAWDGGDKTHDDRDPDMNDPDMNYSDLNDSDLDDSDTANLPVEMLDQLRFDLESAEEEAQLNSIPFIPKPRILGKRGGDRTKNLQDDSQPGGEPFDIRTNVDDRAGDQIDEFRRGLSRLDSDNGRNQRRYLGPDDAQSAQSTNVHSIYEASDSDSLPAGNHGSASLATPPVASGSDDVPERADPDRAAPDRNGPDQIENGGAGQPTATDTSATRPNTSRPNKLSAPVTRDTDADDLATRERERESRANFVNPSLTLNAATSGPDEQRPGPNLQASQETADTVEPASPGHGTTPTPGKTANPAQPRTQPERTRSIKEVLKASLTRTPDTASAAQVAPENVASELPSDVQATPPGLPQTDATPADTIERAQPTVDAGRQKPLEPALQAEPQSDYAADHAADRPADHHDLPAGRYSKALRRRADQDAKEHSPAADAKSVRTELKRAARNGDAPDQKASFNADNADNDEPQATERPVSDQSETNPSQTNASDANTADENTAAADSSDPTARDSRRSIAAKLASLKVVNARTRTKRAPKTPAPDITESRSVDAETVRPVQKPADHRPTDSSAANSGTVHAASPQRPSVEMQHASSHDTDAARGRAGATGSRTDHQPEQNPQSEVLVHRHVPGNTVNKRLSTDDQAGTYTVFLPKLNTPDPVEQTPLVRDPVIVSLAVFSVLFMLTAATGFVISRDIDVDQWLSDRVTDVKSHANGVAENIQNLAGKDEPEIAEQDHTSSIQPVSPKPEPPEPSEQAVAVEQPTDTGLQPVPQPTNPNFEIDGENALTGSLISSNGEPVAGEQIVLVSPSLGARFTTTTRDDGEFTLENLMPGDDYNLSITPAGPYKTLEVFDVSISESNAHLPLTLEAMPTANLSGRIVDADNNAVPNFQLWATGFDEPGQQVNFRSDHEGNYRLYGLPTGKVQFTSKADPKILITSVVLNGGADEVVDLVVDYGTHQIGGIATDADGNPLGGVEITLEWSVKRDTIRSMGTRTTSSDSDGSFRFSELGPGKHFLTARADGLPLIRRSIDVGIDNTEIALSLGATSSDSQIN